MIQCDEIWSFCYAKNRNAPEAKKAAGEAGDLWTFTAIDSESKMILTWLVGDRSGEAATIFMSDLAARVEGRPQISTDGFRGYNQASMMAFWERADVGQVQKIYSASPNHGPDRKYSPGVCVGMKKRRVMGDPDPAKISTSHVERMNLNMRMGMRRFTRLTNGFSKKADNHCAALALYFMWYNWVRQHKTLRTSPAMAAGLTEHLMSMEDVANMIEAANPPKKRGPYKKAA